MTLVLEVGATPLTMFNVPYKGIWNSVAINQITPDALYDSMNVFIRRGKLRERPGLSLLNRTVFDNAVLGGKMAVTPTAKVLLAITRSQLYQLKENDPQWQSDTILTFANNNNQRIDITFLETMNEYVAVIASSNLVLKKWIDGEGASNIVATTGTVPEAISVCTAARRIIALVDPHTIRWSSTLTYDSWPELAIAKVAQTNDIGICVRSLGTLDFVIYKERSIYVAKAQAGSDATAFNIQFIQSTEGPAGCHALVDVGGTHFFMTKSGRIGTFNGSSYVNWIADGLWLFLQGDIDPLYTSKIFGVYDYRLHTITFYYARIGDSGLCKGMVLINLPLQGSGIEPIAGPNGLPAAYVASAFLGICQKPCSYGFEKRFHNTIDSSVIFTNTVDDCQSFTFDDNVRTDDGVTYPCMIQTGLFPLPNMQHHNLQIEAMLERANGNGSCVIYPVTLDALESQQGTVHRDKGQIIDLNSNPVREYIGFNTPTRFFGVRYEWQSNDIVRYGGTTVYGRVVS